MLSNTLESALNEQIKHELYSSYLYLAMSAHCASANMPGAAKWLGMQAKEEQSHAHKIFEFILDRGGKVTLQAIPQPPATYTSLLDVFEQVQKHEATVTGLINRLYETAAKENDYAGQFFLQWFVSEQVEEEKTAASIVDTLRSVGTQGAALFMVDRMLAARGG
jgi:ferritin